MWRGLGLIPPPLTPTLSFNWQGWLESAASRVLSCNKHLSKEKRKARGACIRVCSKKIQLAEIWLQKNPADSVVRDILSESQERLAEVFQNSVERNHHLTSSKWLRYGDTCSKSFFDFHRIGRKKTLLRELETEEGPIGGQSDLALYVTGFYSKLYTSDASA